MTKPPIESVPTLAGRELDSAVHEFVMGLNDTKVFADVVCPHYSTDFRHLEAMIATVRAAGWDYRIWNAGESVKVELSKPSTGPMFGDVDARYGRADTLPLAFARAALMTTYAKENES
jgi:hypothetical protein